MSKEFEYDALVIRTSDKEGKSYNDFQYPLEVGAIVECPDWNPEPVCGGGLHGLLDGSGDWSLLSSVHDALWWIIGIKRDDCVVIDDQKVKFQYGKILYVGGINGALQQMSKEWRKIVERACKDSKENSTTGNSAHASTTGNSAHASTTGDDAHASTTGDDAHASTTGNSAHASTTGNSAHASTTGENSVAVALGWSAQAKAENGGAICLAHIDSDGKLVAIKASLVGENGIEPGVEYELTADGEFAAVE